MSRHRRFWGLGREVIMGLGYGSTFYLKESLPHERVGRPPIGAGHAACEAAGFREEAGFASR